MSGNSPKSMRIGLATENDKDHKAMKFCNCKRSNCLKLYCECFANGNYCQPSRCNCNNCQNNSEYDPQRREAVEAILERNPNAFRSKILITETSSEAQQSHHKGCHCKKSNCLKKYGNTVVPHHIRRYCECFQANVVCTSKCRCVSCRNYSGSEPRAEALLKAVATAAGKSTTYQREQAEAQAAKRRAIDREESNRNVCKELIDKAMEAKASIESAPTSSSETPDSASAMRNAVLDAFTEHLKSRVVQALAVRMGPDVTLPPTTASKYPFTSMTSSTDYNPSIPSFPSITDADFTFTQFADDSLSKKLRASMEKDGGMFDLSNPLTTLIQPNDESKQHFEALPSIVRTHNSTLDTTSQDTDSRTQYWQPSPTEQIKNISEV